ncbi:hypothetical protein HMI54_002727 [Coelomomyces lativittatus]|nr:hypothetical protein HMI55_002874 [Coelomomyces lativittatus]KAJ1518082.1 hypothetical protein HMI54_002727 [Coelomomyces lativittatus]
MDDLTPFQTDVLNETLLSIPNPQATIRDLVAKQFGFPVPDSLQSKFGDEQGDL